MRRATQSNPTKRGSRSVAALILVLAAATRGEPAAADDSAAILEWRFDGASAEPGKWQGKSKLSDVLAEGPRAPRYPGFDENNTGAVFPGKDASILVKDHEKGGAANVRFGAGESFAFEAWVKPKSVGKGHMVYLIGKGRHGGAGENLGEMNQNYAVRLRGTGGGAQLGFLSTSEHPETRKRDWHRWWSKAEMTLTRWHHVAVVYTFGKGDSLQAYIDGKPVEGVWDLGGATDLPPVQDADDLVVGTGYKRSTSESFSGWMDNVALYREALAPEAIAGRYAYVPPPPPVTRKTIPAGRVLVQISEDGVPEANSWPEEPVVTETFYEDVFGFVELPQKYISTGVRADRANPALVRASALVKFPAGRHRILLRARGVTRLYIDGEKMLETGARPTDPSGHGLVSAQDEYLDLGPDFRFAPPGNREDWREFETDGGEHLVVMETLLGGIQGKSKFRPEFGETVVAVSLEGEESWTLLAPGEHKVAYTDEGWAAYESERREWLAQVNAEARAAKRAEHSEYWQKRRSAAAKWLASVEPVAVPELPAGYPAINAIDHFIASRIAEVAAEFREAQSGTIDYFEQVEPILETRCYDCHQGGKAKGDLRLDQHAAALKGGKSDGPAIAPRDVSGSALIRRVTPEKAEDDVMPPKGDPLTKGEIAILTKWIEEGAAWPQFQVSSFELTPPSEDLAFLRRVTLDTAGVPPSEAEIEAFFHNEPAMRRANAIDRLLDDPRWADHWMGYWQDVLAENPNIINPTLNNTGPFRWWIYESLIDNKPADLFVTELLRMEGSDRFGGPRGFGTASQNDVPMAAKGVILSSAFLGVEMKCARCHDAPSHLSLQEDLFQLAAMLERAPVEVPKTSSVPMDRLHENTGRKPLIEVTLEPGSKVEPAWPFARFCDEKTAAALAERADDPRDRLAALVTAPQNERFAQVMANRVWQRLMGRGIVASVSDWEKGEPSHPELLRWLGHRFVASGYDIKALARLILNSHAYQRALDPAAKETGPLYIAPAPRRLDAEQIVDSLFSAAGKPFELEEVSLDLDSVRGLENSITLGKPRRAWMLASTSNERDRPSLSLPRIQAVASVMETFDWTGSRQAPRSHRDSESNVLQPAILANGTMGIWLTRLSDDHGVTRLALEKQPVGKLIDRLFLRLLTRKPSRTETQRYTAILAPGYESRIVPEAGRVVDLETGPRVPERWVSWSNHVDGPANLLAQEKEVESRQGDPPTAALETDWRLRMEDVLWAILNSPEWIYTQ